jgi:hypothetical protein
VNKIPLAVPDPAALGKVQALCELADPFQANQDSDALFVAAMGEIISWHRSRLPFYARLLEEQGVAADRLHSVADCADVPLIHANFFKTHEVLSVPRDDIVLRLTSSGTTGQKSQIFFDAWSIGAGQRMVDFTFEHYGWHTPNQPTNYLLFNYEPEPDWKVGTSYTAHFLCKYAPVNRLSYTLRRTGHGGHEFDIYGALRALQEYAEEGLPVRIFGFPAFLHATLQRMESLRLPPLKLAAGSMTFFGGGWKGQADKAIPKPELYALISTLLGIPDHLIRDGYGSVEHSVPYAECPAHNFHIPVWSRVFIRDVKTLQPLGPGVPGFLNFVAPYVTSVPTHSVLMGDLAAWYPASDCSCGLATPYFVPLGRAGVSKNKSCAIAAAELLKGSAT